MVLKHTFNALALAAALVSPTLLAAPDFTVHDVALGMPYDEVNLLLQETCPRGCMTYTGSGPAGIHSLTVFLRYQTIYFSNTRRTEVNRDKPYESATYTFGPDHRVIALEAEVKGSLTAGKKLADEALARYSGPLQAFTQTNKVAVHAQASLDHLSYLYAPNMTGKQFELSVIEPAPSRMAVTRVNYWDFDAVRALEAAKPTDFMTVRGPAGLGLVPREANAAEAAKARRYPALEIGTQTQAVNGNDKVQVIAEQHDGNKNPPSQLLVNGALIQKSALLSDGMSFEAVQHLGDGLFLVSAAWAGNGCSAQEQILLKVVNGKGHLSEPFGRCEPQITQHAGTTYFNFAETEYEPQQTLATP